MSTAHTDLQTRHGSGPMNRYVISAAAIVFLLATGDLIFACTYWHATYDVPPARLIQNIASGLLGKRAFAGGENTVLLGVVLQYFMISLMVGTYYVTSRRIKALNAKPWLWGLLYGLVLYVTMNHVVVPLSAAPRGPVIASWIILSIVVHLVIGVTVALGARWAANKS
ncbi:hypothetical protein EKH79_17265 [Dyella dinghuensis]|uniref:DUF1440 domain-containing protein n=1 Tax=Dyella dinghuensis TaxID=1920169 RepID=A0A3S0WLT3_9GAMM|nr:hypothetical protein [Dyella dinghuensis]RUL61388.1 hypothetical protein EKH79_17265 [Dyella dinghuensis]